MIGRVSESAAEPEAEWPWATLAVSAAILAVFAFECALGLEDAGLGLEDNEAFALVRAGAIDYGSVFVAGEWWRLLGAAFAHGGLVHLVLNGWAFIQLGALVEEVWGRTRFAVVYLLACLGGSLASAAVGGGLAVGASTGIMGLVGFLIAARYTHDADVRAFLRAILGRQLLFWTAFIFGLGALLGLLSAALGPAVPRIDNWGHLGGLTTGLVLALAVRGRGPANAGLHALAALLVAATVASLAGVALRGDESARLEKALLETVAAVETNDVAAIRSGLAAIDAIPGNPRRVVGRRIEYAQALVTASIAAGLPKDAVRYGEAAAELDPSLGAAILGQARLAAGDERAASDALDRFRETASTDELRSIGLQLEQQGHTALAVRFLDTALARAPDDPLVLNELAWTLLTGKELGARDGQRAFLLARRAAFLAGRPGLIHLALRGVIPGGRKADDYEQAQILDTLAEAELQLGLVTLALDHEEKALALAHEAGKAGLEPSLEERLAKIKDAAR
jgi:rhomboid protease GluP